MFPSLFKRLKIQASEPVVQPLVQRGSELSEVNERFDRKIEDCNKLREQVDGLDDRDYGLREIQKAANGKFEIWQNPHPANDYLVEIEHPEFTAKCPRSGYPDFGTIAIAYYPFYKVAELKSIKLYINSFAERRVGHEEVVNIIADKFFEEVNPKALRVVGDFKRRGNVKTVITVHRGVFSLEFPQYVRSEL